MKRLSSFTLILFISAFVIGCATSASMSQEEKDKIMARTYDAPADRIYQAAANFLIQEGYSIENSDKDLGIITTGWRSADAATAMITGNYETKITVQIMEKDNGRFVRLNPVKRNVGAWGQKQGKALFKHEMESAAKEFFTSLEANI